MNCQEICSILDDRCIAGLSDADRDVVEAHLRVCDDCADEWSVQQRLSKITIPAMPVALARQCRALVSAQTDFGADSRGKRRMSRMIVIGTLAAVAAAAALLSTVLLKSEKAPEAIAAATAVSPAEPVTEARGDTAIAPTVSPAITSAGPGKKTQPPLESPRFTVLVLPLQDRTTDEASRLATRAFYSALLDGLRAVPGLTLLQVGSVGNDIAPTEYQLTVSADGPVQGRWSARMLLKASMSVTVDAQEQRATVPQAFQYSSVAAPACTGSLVDRPVTDCSDPKSGAAGQVDLMRLAAFPPDPSARRALQARLLDRTLSPDVRFKALADLQFARAAVVRGPQFTTLVERRPDLDKVTLHGVVDLLATTSNPDIRAQISRLLRGTPRPELVQPLIDSYQLDTNDSSRLEVATTLAADYAQDPKGREALESMVRNDPRELTRMVAKRALSGDASWIAYVLHQVQDPELADARRLEALTYMSASGQGQKIRELLNAQAVAALAQIMPRALASFPESSAFRPTADGLVGLASNLAATNQPATIDLLIGMLQSTSDPMIRQISVYALARHHDDARALAALEEIKARDPDPQLRDAAASHQPQLVTPPPGT